MHILDGDQIEALSDTLSIKQMWNDVRRIKELRDPSVSHDWLWMLNPAIEPTIPASEFPICLRARLGAHFINEGQLCSRCGKYVLGRTCAHALCCAMSESTKGHYKVRDQVLNLCHLADPASLVEAPELISSAPALRPADIFTCAALPGRQAALDVGICSPDAAGAGNDCCENMRKRKMEDYGAYLDGMEQVGIIYLLLIFSCFGRIHP